MNVTAACDSTEDCGFNLPIIVSSGSKNTKVTFGQIVLLTIGYMCSRKPPSHPLFTSGINLLCHIYFFSPPVKLTANNTFTGDIHL